MTDQPAVGEPLPASAPLPDTPRWGLGDAALGFLAGLLLSILATSVWVVVTGDDEVTLAQTVVALLGLWTGLGGATLLASRRKGSGSLATDFGLRIEARDIGPGLLAGVAAQLVVVPLLYLPLDLLGADLDVSEEARRVTDLATGPAIALLAVAIIVGAPFVEELFFRGLLQRSVARRLGPNWAIALSSVTFGITHFQPVQLLGLAAFGVILAVLAQRSGRLGPSLIAHMAFNATTVAILVATR